MTDEKIACFPRLGDYHILIELLLERCLGYKTINCPPTTKKTIEIGSKYSPDTICTPFKVTLGNLLEGLHLGANVLVMPGIGCRLGFYDILQKQVLEDLGYQFEMLTLFDLTANASRLYRSLCTHKPDLSLEKFNEVLAILIKIAKDMDWLADFRRQNAAFELNKGEFLHYYQQYLLEAKSLQKALEAQILGNRYREIFSNIKIDKPEKALRIVLIGDLYTVIEPSGNCYIEDWLIEHKFEIHRKIDLIYLNETLFDVNKQIEKCGGYAKYNLGGSAINNIALAYEFAKEGIDGIIHMKAATCSPEITAMTILQDIAIDYNVPIMYLTFDTETSETGIYTRLEAFQDMLEMKRKEN